MWDSKVGGMVVKKAKTPATKVASRPFTRDLESWRQDPERMSLPTLPILPNGAFYKSSGKSTAWTKAQRQVPRQEQATWEQKKLKEFLKQAANNKAPNHGWRGGEKKYLGYRALAIVDGRKHGQPAVAKDQRLGPFPSSRVCRGRTALMSKWSSGNLAEIGNPSRHMARTGVGNPRTFGRAELAILRGWKHSVHLLGRTLVSCLLVSRTSSAGFTTTINSYVYHSATDLDQEMSSSLCGFLGSASLSGFPEDSPMPHHAFCS